MSSVNEALAIKALVTQAERLYPMEQRLLAKIKLLEEYQETHHQHVTGIVLGVLKEIYDAKAH